MTEFCLSPEKLEAMLTEINRHRVLTEDEVDMLEALINRGHKTTGKNFRWKPADDRALLKASIKRGGIQKFADDHGIPRKGAYDRLNRLRGHRDAKLNKQAERVG